jgi:hypothetical protein
MDYESWFDTNENRTLLAICARKQIKNIGIGGIIWGILNTGIGVFAIQVDVVNVGLLILGAIMLGAGIQALRQPSLGVLLTETLVTILLLVWNVGIAVYNFHLVGAFDPRGIVFPVIVALIFFNNYKKLQHVKDLIVSVKPDDIKATKQVCKTLVKKKLKNEPAIIETNDRKCRAQLMDDRAFFIQRDLMRAFVVAKDQIHLLIPKPEEKKLKVTVRHPLGKLSYAFDKKNTEKLKAWLLLGKPPALP